MSPNNPFASQHFDFNSDNAAGIHPAILQAIQDCNSGFASPCGVDVLTDTIDDDSLLTGQLANKTT